MELDKLEQDMMELEGGGECELRSWLWGEGKVKLDEAGLPSRPGTGIWMFNCSSALQTDHKMFVVEKGRKESIV